MKYRAGDLLQDNHPETKGKNNLIMVLQATAEQYVIWKGMTNSIVEWDREGLEDDLHLTKVK
jgi:hypothetical protein